MSTLLTLAIISMILVIVGFVLSELLGTNDGMYISFFFMLLSFILVVIISTQVVK